MTLRPIRIKRLLDAAVVDRLVGLLERAGYAATPEQAEELWIRLSDDYGSTTTGMPRDDVGVVRMLEPFFEAEAD